VAKKREDIALIGMSGRFPSANNVNEFWANLRDGVESIDLFSAAELVAAGLDSVVLENPAYVRAGSVLEDIDLFDASFFGFRPREAESLDPQHRIFLETAWHALEDAGYDPARFTGCGGSIVSESDALCFARPPRLDRRRNPSALGNFTALLAPSTEPLISNSPPRRSFILSPTRFAT
jgi:acyl transferase domain-containing protein